MNDCFKKNKQRMKETFHWRFGIGPYKYNFEERTQKGWNPKTNRGYSELPRHKWKYLMRDLVIKPIT